MRSHAETGIVARLNGANVAACRGGVPEWDALRQRFQDKSPGRSIPLKRIPSRPGAVISRFVTTRGGVVLRVLYARAEANRGFSPLRGEE